MGIRQVKTRGKRAVFLDRDGVLNAAVVRDGLPYPPAAPEELEILPGVETALLRLRAAGFATIVVTNQPDVARKTRSREDVEAINARLSELLAIDEVFVCYHDDPDACSCRKPKPGLLVEAARRRGLDLARSYMVGDRWRDIDAGAAAGCTTILIDYGYGEKGPATPPDAVTGSLLQASEIILNAETKKETS